MPKSGIKKGLLYDGWVMISQARVAIYARVSTLDKGQDPETQLMALREYAERRGFQIVGSTSTMPVVNAKTGPGTGRCSKPPASGNSMWS
ncbi:MAG: hypothetical protein ETSY1_46650 (plasmid) [Candidatus Entotheonella factor]|uniref:Resolvase/invertase-type recombinase catalytic domain-containing protein n=1 Tax=Entotheonella factor TaxID=1429438 RepID=W4M1S9_ENTF1|nr:MAG: hypothetical protein ETSY1_46650 [Candidatus Entotheonella factor]